MINKPLSLDIEISRIDMLKAEALLIGVKNGREKVTARAVNKTLAGVRTDSVNEISKVITANKKIIRKAFSIYRASPRKLTARVESRGEPLGLIHFRARQTKKGVTAQVLKKKPRKLYKGAFIATIKNAENVFWRKYHEAPSRPPRPGVKYRRLPKKYRLPIQRLTGPRIPDIMGKPATLKRIQAKANERLKKNLKHELDYMLSKL